MFRQFTLASNDPFQFRQPSSRPVLDKVFHPLPAVLAALAKVLAAQLAQFDFASGFLPKVFATVALHCHVYSNA